MGLRDAAKKLQHIFSIPAALLKRFWALPTVRFCVLLFAALSAAVPAATVFFVKISQNKKESRELPAISKAETKKIEDVEIFILEEPDFLPKALLKREPSAVWTSEKAQEYWIDPSLETDKEVLLNNVEKSIDKLLENVP
ncbi:MAG: hypothetical protein LBC53_01840 [Spirochaetaceae bacterium]|nr:hypothetical protein [Spirochaetaceae bacterium]